MQKIFVDLWIFKEDFNNSHVHLKIKKKKKKKNLGMIYKSN